jgi:hypothetical protein
MGVLMMDDYRTDAAVDEIARLKAGISQRDALLEEARADRFFASEESDAWMVRMDGETTGRAPALVTVAILLVSFALGLAAGWLM